MSEKIIRKSPSGPEVEVETPPVTSDEVTNESDVVGETVTDALNTLSAASGGSLPDFSWWPTDIWPMTVGGSQPSGALLLMASYNAIPGLDNTPVPTGFDFHQSRGAVTNTTLKSLVVRCRAVVSALNGSFPSPSIVFCKNETIPDITNTATFAVNVVGQTSIVGDSIPYNMVSERTIVLAPGDDVGPAFGWGTPGESASPNIRSLLISYTVVAEIEV